MGRAFTPRERNRGRSTGGSPRVARGGDGVCAARISAVTLKSNGETGVLARPHRTLHAVSSLSKFVILSEAKDLMLPAKDMTLPAGRCVRLIICIHDGVYDK